MITKSEAFLIHLLSVAPPPLAIVDNAKFQGEVSDNKDVFFFPFKFTDPLEPREPRGILDQSLRASGSGETGPATI